MHSVSLCLMHFNPLGFGGALGLGGALDFGVVFGVEVISFYI